MHPFLSGKTFYSRAAFSLIVTYHRNRFPFFPDEKILSGIEKNWFSSFAPSASNYESHLRPLKNSQCKGCLRNNKISKAFNDADLAIFSFLVTNPFGFRSIGKVSPFGAWLSKKVKTFFSKAHAKVRKSKKRRPYVWPAKKGTLREFDRGGFF